MKFVTASVFLTVSGSNGSPLAGLKLTKFIGSGQNYAAGQEQELNSFKTLLCQDTPNKLLDASAKQLLCYLACLFTLNLRVAVSRRVNAAVVLLSLGKAYEVFENFICNHFYLNGFANSCKSRI